MATRESAEPPVRLQAYCTGAVHSDSSMTAHCAATRQVVMQQDTLLSRSRARAEGRAESRTEWESGLRPCVRWMPLREPESGVV